MDRDILKRIVLENKRDVEDILVKDALRSINRRGLQKRIMSEWQKVFYKNSKKSKVVLLKKGKKNAR